MDDRAKLSALLNKLVNHSSGEETGSRFMEGAQQGADADGREVALLATELDGETLEVAFCSKYIVNNLLAMAICIEGDKLFKKDNSFQARVFDTYKTMVDRAIDDNQTEH